MKEAEDTKSICGEVSVLRCKANSLPGVTYRSVRWYKLSEEPYNKESGLLMKRLSHNSAPPNAPVGEQNQEGQIVLSDRLP
ncbi:hypothetical protein J4Q44_G00387850 [Coregonus suidteri]|uniref:Uncharacterized protein n=1 Tax=Coregonus suidteri TaxID=861788 RepID=A0AAN8KQP0_9TELE